MAKIELKLNSREILRGHEALLRLRTHVVPGYGLAIAENEHRLNEALANLRQAEQDLIRKYAEKDADGNVITQPDGSVRAGNPAKFTQERMALYAEEVEIEVHQVPRSAIRKVPDLPAEAVWVPMLCDCG